MNLPALEFSNAIPKGKVIQMTYNCQVPILDLAPFFKEFFDERDKWLGHPDYKRINDNCYQFTFEEFAETFIGPWSYDPATFVQFLRKHTASEDIQAESLCKRLLNFHACFRQAVVEVKHFERKDSLYYFGAIDFPNDELQDYLKNIPSEWRSSTQCRTATYYREMDDGRNILLSSPMRMEVGREDLTKRRTRYVRDLLLETSPPILLAVAHVAIDLDDFSYLRHYDKISTKGLKIVRE